MENSLVSKLYRTAAKVLLITSAAGTFGCTGSQMLAVRDPDGNYLVDKTTGEKIVKAVSHTTPWGSVIEIAKQPFTPSCYRCDGETLAVVPGQAPADVVMRGISGALMGAGAATMGAGVLLGQTAAKINNSTKVNNNPNMTATGGAATNTTDVDTAVALTSNTAASATGVGGGATVPVTIRSGTNPTATP